MYPTTTLVASVDADRLREAEAARRFRHGRRRRTRRRRYRLAAAPPAVERGRA